MSRLQGPSGPSLRLTLVKVNSSTLRLSTKRNGPSNQNETGPRYIPLRIVMSAELKLWTALIGKYDPSPLRFTFADTFSVPVVHCSLHWPSSDSRLTALSLPRSRARTAAYTSSLSSLRVSAALCTVPTGSGSTLGSSISALRATLGAGAKPRMPWSSWRHTVLPPSKMTTPPRCTSRSLSCGARASQLLRISTMFLPLRVASSKGRW
mmetsp:Transcript_15627/g.53365  ORF Transcript_15627/g.53365 Transcript_15627/m.53365 type:complete len:208 (+) Transcript_15627:456-1079(+)